MAVALQGSSLVTQDLDLYPSGDRANLSRLALALTEADAYQYHAADVWVPITGDTLAARQVATR